MLKNLFSCFLVMLPLCLPAQVVMKVTLEDSTTKEVLVVPQNYRADYKWKELGKIKSGMPLNKKDLNFNLQLDKTLSKLVDKGGNILQVTHIDNVKQMGLYNVAGDGYFTPDYENVKRVALAAKSEKYKGNEKFSYLTIYRANYSDPFNGLGGLRTNNLYNVNLVLNDSATIKMKSGSKYVIKVVGDTVYNLKFEGSDVGRAIPVKAGTDKYVRIMVDISRASNNSTASRVKLPASDLYAEIQIIKIDTQGELESALITDVAQKQ